MSFGFYWKKFLFFGAIVAIVGVSGYLFSKQISSASIREAASQVSYNQYEMNIDIQKNGKVLINNKSVPGLMHMGKDSDEFRYLAVSEEGIYVDYLTIYVHLPEPVNADQIQQNVYAIHGIEAYNYYIQDPQTLVYTARSLSPVSTFTVVADLPKSLINFPIISKILFDISNISPIIWIIVSLTLPIITLILLFWLFQQKINDWRLPKTKDEVSKPPSDISPGEVEILMFGKISSRAVAATFISLAQRGFIYIVQRVDGFSFGKRKLYDPITKTFNSQLNDFEKSLASKVFTEESLKSGTQDILMRVGRHVFSRKIAQVYISFYDAIAKRGYFFQNPSKFHRKYYITGLVLFFVALAFFIFGIWVAPDPKYLLIFWFMMMLSALLIVRMAPQLPLRTNLGKEQYIQWLKFRNYLMSSKSIYEEGGTQDLFEKYLPYAIAMECEVEWAKRFVNVTFKLPDWYVSEKPITVVEDFMASILPIIGFISQSLVASKEPIVQ